MAYYLIFMILGYLSGSVLYAKLFGYLFRRRDIIRDAALKAVVAEKRHYM